METQYISLNMTPTGVNPCFHISQYDVGRMLGFIVHSGGATVDLDTYTCTIEATRSDGTAITSAVATTDNIGTFEVTPTMSNKTDKYRCQFVIVDANSKRIASLPFDMEVTKAAMDENSEAIEEDASLYQQYTEAVQGAIAEANADIQAEENARIAAVSAEATARADAITAEATARQTADNTLQENINSEVSARQASDNTLQSNINAEASARASADSNLQSQINQIIAPSGEAPSAAEVENARIGADGTVHGTLGDAIRIQNSDLKSAIDELTSLGIEKRSEQVTFTGEVQSTGGIISDLQIKKGEKFSVMVLSDTQNPLESGGLQVYSPSDTYITSITNNDFGKFKEVTAPWDVLSLGLRDTDGYLKANVKMTLIVKTGFYNDQINDEKDIHYSLIKQDGFASPIFETKCTFTKSGSTVHVDVPDRITYFYKNKDTMTNGTIPANSMTNGIDVPNLNWLYIRPLTSEIVTGTDEELTDELKNGIQPILLFFNHYGRIKGDWYWHYKDQRYDSDISAINQKQGENIVSDYATFSGEVQTEAGMLSNLTIKNGDKFYIKIESDTVNPLESSAVQIIINGTTFLRSVGNSGIGSFIEITATRDITSIGLRDAGGYLKANVMLRITVVTGVYKLIVDSEIKTETVRNEANGYPNSYYYIGKWLNTKIDEVRNQISVENGISFPFITDVHFPSNSLQSKYLIKQFLDNTSMPFCICGGDFPGAYGTENDLKDSVKILQDYFKVIGKNRFFTVRGNHDFTIKTNSGYETRKPGSGATLSTGASYDVMTRNSEFYIDSIEAGKFYYYIDVPASKTRIFMLSSCDTQSSDPTASWAVDYNVSQDQIYWLLDRLQEKNGWHYIFISHISPEIGVSGYAPSQQVFHDIEVALANKTNYNNYDFSKSTNEVVCHICGHNHTDESNIDNGVLTISTTSDAYYTDGGWVRAMGTVTEQAFDVFTFDYENRTITAKRIGGGEDRKWNY